MEPVFKRILGHPFVTGLTDGSLPMESFAYYVAQDAHYLRDYARALAMVSAKAPDEASVAMFAAHAQGALGVEQQLHAGFARARGQSRRGAGSARVTDHRRVQLLPVASLRARRLRAGARRGAAVLLDLRRGGRHAGQAVVARPVVRPLDRDIRR